MVYVAGEWGGRGVWFGGGLALTVGGKGGVVVVWGL